MVAVARRNLAAFPLVDVVHADAERWNPPTTDVDLVVSQSDRETRASPIGATARRPR